MKEREHKGVQLSHPKLVPLSVPGVESDSGVGTSELFRSTFVKSTDKYDHAVRDIIHDEYELELWIRLRHGRLWTSCKGHLKGSQLQNRTYHVGVRRLPEAPSFINHLYYVWESTFVQRGCIWLRGKRVRHCTIFSRKMQYLKREENGLYQQLSEHPSLTVL
jgi:hypothetical protein